MKKLKKFGNVEKAKSKDFEWFQKVVEGYVKSGKITKPTQKEIEKVWEETTGQKLEKSKNK